MSDEPIARVLAALPTATANGNGWYARCPAHDDQRASLSISTGGDGRVLVKCFANCKTSAIVAALGLTMRDLFPTTNGATPEIAYDYVDETGALLFQVVRRPPKRFTQRRPDGNGEWIWKLDGVRRVLYRLPDLVGHEAVLLAEGEKDVEMLRRHGFTATCNPHGAGKWRDEYAEQLRAAGCTRVAIVPDNDPAGLTHARQVAQSCHNTGLFVKIVPLAGLPKKGDVSDYLQQHTRDDLREAIHAAPPFNPERLVAEPPPFALTTMAEFLAEPEPVIRWIVEDRIPAGGVVLAVGAPKSGKSTMLRELAVAVARGEPWLGWRTTPGRVWLLCFEDQRSEIQRHLRRLGVTASDPLSLFSGQAPPDLIQHLEARAATEPPSLIILDTLARVLRVKDLNDYAQVTAACDPMLRLARSTGAALVPVHHASVHATREGLDAILGSTALAGSVDNVMVLRRAEHRRTLSTVQRVGPDLEPTIIALDAQTGRLACAGTKRIVEDRELRDQILAALATATVPVRETWIAGQVEGQNKAKVRALRVLLSQGFVVRSERGGRGAPFLYRLADSRSHISGTSNDRGEARERESEQKSATNPGLFTDESILVPEVPCIYRERESENDVRTNPLRTSSTDDPILVPEGSQIAQTRPAKTAETPDKQGSDSRSQNIENGRPHERF
jgi:hypothetical protein